MCSSDVWFFQALKRLRIKTVKHQRERHSSDSFPRTGVFIIDYNLQLAIVLTAEIY